MDYKAENNDNPADLSCLREYTDNDPESMVELIELFHETFSEDLKELERNVTDGENEEWSGIAHKLKGASGYVGAKELESLCSEAQNMRVGSVDDRRNLHQKIRDSYTVVRTFLEENKDAYCK